MVDDVTDLLAFMAIPSSSSNYLAYAKKISKLGFNFEIRFSPKVFLFLVRSVKVGFLAFF